MDHRSAERRDKSPGSITARTTSSSLPDITSASKSEDGEPRAGEGSIIPNAVPGPVRRNTTIIPPVQPPRNKAKTLPPKWSSFPATPVNGVRGRPFLISPWPRTGKSSRSSSRKRDAENVARANQFGLVMLEKRGEDTKSDATDEELEHEMRMAEKRRRSEFPRRLVTAIVGGIFVIAPMVIMSLHRTLTKSLVTSSVAVLLFGVTLAWSSTSDDSSLFVATAGYAAFLAVFVAVGDESTEIPDFLRNMTSSESGV